MKATFSKNDHMPTSTTYEANKALKSTQAYADKIHWDSTLSFRDSPYRHLHHQRGVIGSFRIRLLEARNLQRSYWSALALGPVKHLGLSKAHGDVSSFCCFDLEFHDDHGSDELQHIRFNIEDSKPLAKISTVKKSNRSDLSSSVVPANNNPIWDNCQFECPLLKGTLEDGQRVYLSVRVYEDATAVENLLPGVPGGTDDSRLLGVGKLDLTELCLGESVNGQALPGIVDSWLPLTLPSHSQQVQQKNYNDNSFVKNCTLELGVNEKPRPAESSIALGYVRILVSYQAHGLEPQQGDVVALEAFARRDPKSSSCRPLLPPLLPMTVKERSGSYLLVEYLPDFGPETTSGCIPAIMKLCCRLHRNSVFVIERKNLVDAAHNLALFPIDVIANTSIGQATLNFTNPIVTASRELMMPILLSLKLVWVATRTTTLAGLSGVSALGSTFWNEGTGSLTNQHERDQHLHHERSTATAQFVSL